MKATLTREAQQLVDEARSAPIDAAARAAVIVYTQLAGRALKPGEAELWPALGTLDATPAAIAIRVNDVLVPFVRANPAAPAESLYLHARAAGVHARASRFADLALNERAAYETFRSVLAAIDAGLAADRARLPGAKRAQKRIPLEDTMYAPADPRFDQASYLKRDKPYRSAPVTTPKRPAKSLGLADPVEPPPPPLTMQPFGVAPIHKGERKGDLAAAVDKIKAAGKALVRGKPDGAKKRGK